MNFRSYKDPPSAEIQITHSSLVEGLQPISQSHTLQSQKIILTNPTDIIYAENPSSAIGVSGDEPVSYEEFARICHTQQQTIALLVEEKTALTSELEKYSAMTDRFKNSEELLEEGQLLVDALRRKNAELEEKIKNGEDKLKEAGEQKEKIIESLQSQVF